jgi:hypothetical protein
MREVEPHRPLATLPGYFGVPPLQLTPANPQARCVTANQNYGIAFELTHEAELLPTSFDARPMMRANV